jgi:diphthine synthase
VYFVHASSCLYCQPSSAAFVPIQYTGHTCPNRKDPVITVQLSQINTFTLHGASGLATGRAFRPLWKDACVLYIPQRCGRRQCSAQQTNLAMVLYLIGLGLCDEKDVSLRGLEAIKRCERVYLEAYTSVLLCDVSRLEELYGRPVIVADREMVENEADDILEGAKEADIAFLVVGDPFGATTHSDLQLRAAAAGVPVRVIHNASVMNAIGACGLQLYRFGEAVSIVFFTESWRPDSFYDRIAANQAAGLHTLCLLDIKVKEPDLAALARGRTIYEPPRCEEVVQ